MSRRKCSRKDWIERGLHALAEGGHSALQVAPLARALGVTKGSFYWHFGSVRSYRDGIVEAWLQLDTTETARAALASESPLEELYRQIVDRRLLELDDAFREWAREDHAIAEAVAHNEVLRLRRVQEILMRLGLDRSSARVRAQMIVWVASRSTDADMRWRHRVLRETLAVVEASCSVRT